MKVEAIGAIAQDPHHKDTDHIYLAMEKLKSTIKKAKAELDRHRIFTGMYDKEGTPIYVGDLLDFDEREWGQKFTPEKVPPLLDFVEGWPLSGTYCDVGTFRKVVNKAELEGE